MNIINHLLFSELFFQQIRRETADLTNLRTTLATIRDTWRYYIPPPSDYTSPGWRPDAPLPLGDAGRLRTTLVEPIFGYLELTYGPCEDDPRAFFLYGDWEMHDRTGLCLVLPYTADIEGRDAAAGGIIPKGRNYAQQLMQLLRRFELDWGVLTNGRQWRLLHRTELSPTETYLHVDLEHIILEDAMADYIVFHRFFSRAAFVSPRGAGEGPRVKSQLDLYQQRSDQATRVIETHLSGQVEEIVRQLCQGLVESCRAAGEDVTAADRRKEIYKNALYLVYRLLFILYAEARELLPLENPAYQAVCLRDLLTAVRDNHRDGLRALASFDLWERLQALFALIDQGKPEAGVPAYNGGLFDPGRRPFLTRHQVRNEYLQAALIRLSALPAKGLSYDQDREPQPIDYRDLSVRHLGSLYEGLLEYNLFVVENESRVVRAGKKETEYIPYSQAGKVRAGETVLQVGEVYVSETAGERKATGSYYTPEDVVDYIVRRTVGEQLVARQREYWTAQQIERQLADWADTPADIPARAQIQQAIDDQLLRFVQEQVLTLKILDPAMGSGHFLVNATYAVANFIVEVLNTTPWENPALDTDVATWKRRVAERCIFGVDLNELAVELSKLCLWMTTAAQGKPLTYLDHHLRWGNSLVGAWLKEVGVYPLVKKTGKAAFTPPFGSFRVALEQVLAGYRELYAKDSDDVEEVRQKARLFEQEIRPALERYRELLDAHTALYFGARADETTYAQWGAAVDDATTWAGVKELGLGTWLRPYADRRWFHWELEFPEVFAGARRGFDVVVGNPPYVRQERIADHKGFLQAAFAEVYSGGADLYVYFIGQGIKALATNGLLGFVTANKWLRADYAAPLREALPRLAHPVELLDFGHSDIFHGTDTFPCILIVSGRGEAEPETKLRFADVSDRVRGKKSLLKQISEHSFLVPLMALQREEWLLEPTDISELLSHLQRGFPTLLERKGVNTLFGIKTGFNEAFYLDTFARQRLIDADSNCAPLLHRLLRGRSMQRWRPAWEGDWIIGIPSSTNYAWPWSGCDDEKSAEFVFQQSYPSIYAHLKPFETALRQREDQGRFWWELRSCDYYEALKKPKIVVQRILYHSNLCLDNENYWVNDSTIFLNIDDLYVLALVNSRIMWWYMYRLWPHMKDEAIRVQNQKLLALPIPTPPADLRARIEELVQEALLLAGTPSLALLAVEQKLNEYVNQAYGLTPAEIAVIEQTLPPRDPLVVAAKWEQQNHSA